MTRSVTVCFTTQNILRCKQELGELPTPITRQWQLKSIDLYFKSFIHSHFIEATAGRATVRVLQWNHLSQTLGTKGDIFVECPAAALSWSGRRWRILEELVRHQPDIICLQEVDHFHTLERALGSIGYLGK